MRGSYDEIRIFFIFLSLKIKRKKNIAGCFSWVLMMKDGTIVKIAHLMMKNKIILILVRKVKDSPIFFSYFYYLVTILCP